MLGQITQWTQQTDNNAARELDMQYDAAGQLVNATFAPGGGAATNAWSYGYDAAGNRSSEELDTLTGTPVITMTTSAYNTVNELTARNGAGPLPVMFHEGVGP